MQTSRMRGVVTSILLPGIVLVAACGGSDGGGSTPPNAAVGGLWFGTTTISGQSPSEVLGIVAENGKAYLLQEDGVMYWGTVTSSGNQISSTFDGAGLLSEPLWDGSVRGTGTLTGTIQARDLITASSTFTTSKGSRTTATVSLDYDALYNDDSSLATIAGNYVDALGIYGGVLNIANNGDLFLQDPNSGCVLNGRVAVINAAYNAYDIQFTYSNCAGFDSVFNGVTFTGLAAYERTSGEAIALVQGTVSGAPYPNAFVFERV
jgi:hypothetical protein